MSKTYSEEYMTDESIKEMQKLIKTGWRFSLFETKTVRTRMGRRNCPPSICMPR